MPKHILTLLACLLLTACAGGIVPAPRTADYYMREGDELLAENRYEDAIASWEKVRERYVSPEMNALAELKIADTHFSVEHYLEASVAYEEFLKQHPDHDKIADILYRLGVSYYQQMLSPERDQTLTRNALATFDTLLKRFPTDKRRNEIEPLMERCRDHLAGHELHIGEYYLRTEKYAAAIGRLEPLVSQYPRYSDRDAVYFFLAVAQFHSGNRNQATDYFNRLYREYPESKFIGKAQTFLEKEF